MYIVDGMRPNMDLDANPLHVKYTFMDNLVAQIYPAKPGDINGSAMISDFPEYSQAIKNCTALRKSYLPYFTEGTMLSDCILTESCKNARITAYQREDSIVTYVVKSDDADAVFHYDVRPFIGEKPLTAVIRDEQNRELERYQLDVSGAITLSGQKEDLLVIKLTHKNYRRGQCYYFIVPGVFVLCAPLSKKAPWFSLFIQSGKTAILYFLFKSKQQYKSTKQRDKL